MKKDESNEVDKKSALSSDKKGVGTMNIILVIVGISLFAFTVAMVRIFLIYGAIPDTLCTCVFAALGGECGIMGMIKSTKEKYKDREWQKEDRQQEAPVKKESKEDSPEQ